MTEQILRLLGEAAFFQISGTRQKLMPVNQDPSRDQRRILQRSQPEDEIYPFRNVIHHPFRYQHLNPDIRMSFLKRAQQRGPAASPRCWAVRKAVARLTPPSNGWMRYY